jgi:hypothetical protein
LARGHARVVQLPAADYPVLGSRDPMPLHPGSMTRLPS